MLITFEGVEGSGKSTQIYFLVKWLNKQGFPNLKTKEPGGTYIGSKIRSILLNLKNNKIYPLTELMLCLADRIQHIEEIVNFSLCNGFVIICDRYFDSTLVYQGIARGLDLSLIWKLHLLLCNNIIPDLTLLLDIDPKISLTRTRKRKIKQIIHKQNV